jgi:predicted nucleic acid-binding protein
LIYLLDTDALIFLIRGLKGDPSFPGHKKAQHLLRRIKATLSAGAAVGISALTRAELEYGAAKNQDPAKERAALEKVLAPFDESG